MELGDSFEDSVSISTTPGWAMVIVGKNSNWVRLQWERLTMPRAERRVWDALFWLRFYLECTCGKYISFMLLTPICYPVDTQRVFAVRRERLIWTDNYLITIHRYSFLWYPWCTHSLYPANNTLTLTASQEND